MGHGRGLGSSKIWVKGKKHSFVSIGDAEEIGTFTVTFQNEKFETKTMVLDAKSLIQRAGFERFMGIK